MFNNLAAMGKKTSSRYMVMVGLDLPFFLFLLTDQLHPAAWYAFPSIFTPLCSPFSAFQINFRCKPSFRESSSRNLREVSFPFRQLWEVTLPLVLEQLSHRWDKSWNWFCHVSSCSANYSASSLGASETARRQMQTMREGSFKLLILNNLQIKPWY